MAPHAVHAGRRGLITGLPRLPVYSGTMSSLRLTDLPMDLVAEHIVGRLSLRDRISAAWLTPAWRDYAFGPDGRAWWTLPSASVRVHSDADYDAATRFSMRGGGTMLTVQTLTLTTSRHCFCNAPVLSMMTGVRDLIVNASRAMPFDPGFLPIPLGPGACLAGRSSWYEFLGEASTLADTLTSLTLTMHDMFDTPTCDLTPLTNLRTLSITDRTFAGHAVPKTLEPPASLTALRLEHVDFSGGTEDTLRHLTALQRLEAVDATWNADALPTTLTTLHLTGAAIPDGNFLDHLPHLRHLELAVDWFNFDGWGPPALRRRMDLPRLETLVVHAYDDATTPRTAADWEGFDVRALVTPDTFRGLPALRHFSMVYEDGFRKHTSMENPGTKIVVSTEAPRWAELLRRGAVAATGDLLTMDVTQGHGSTSIVLTTRPRRHAVPTWTWLRALSPTSLRLTNVIGDVALPRLPTLRTLSLHDLEPCTDRGTPLHGLADAAPNLRDLAVRGPWARSALRHLAGLDRLRVRIEHAPLSPAAPKGLDAFLT